MDGTFTARQLELFSNGSEQPSGTGLRDPAFAENKSLPIHRWVPWIAGYSAGFIDDVLAMYAPDSKAATVLDPFAGVGTTLVQAMLHGYRTVGFEINPYASLAAGVKVRAPFLDLARLKRLVGNLCNPSSGWKSRPMTSDSAFPKGFRSRIPFFNPNVEAQVLRLIDFIAEVEEEELRDLLRVAFGSVMVSFSNYTYEPSLGTRPGAGKPIIENQDATAIMVGKLRQMMKDIEWVQARCRPLPLPHRVMNANFLAKGEEALSGDEADLLITSPPYMNNYHYVRNTRPQLYWLALVSTSSELKRLEEENFGKFWQNVRTAGPLEPVFTHPVLSSLIGQLRQIRVDKGPYGGPGWANYVTAYFNDVKRFFVVLSRVLKPGGVAVIVVGNSIIQGIEFKVDRFFADLAQSEGLIPEAMHPIREKRVGASITRSSVRRGRENGATLYEKAVVVRRPCG